MNVTDLAPPQLVFWKIEPPDEQLWVSVQVLPSGIPNSQSMSASWEEEICISLIDMESSLPQDIEGASSRLPLMHLLWN